MKITTRLLFTNILLLGLYGCFPECKKNYHKEIISKNGELKAVAVDIQCGSTTDNGTWVLITGTVSDFNEQRDVAAVFIGQVESISWQDEQLVIYQGNAKATTTSTIFRSIPVKYIAALQNTNARGNLKLENKNCSETVLENK